MLPSSVPQNKDRLTGPPMQKGAGTGSMFADGRKGQAQGIIPPSPNYPQGGPGRMSGNGQPQSSMPPGTPNYPQGGPGRKAGNGQAQGSPSRTPNYPQGGMRMMADGGTPSGFGNPSPIGGPPDVDPSSQGAPPDMDDATPPPAGAMAMIKPEAVNYHDEPWSCQGCMHMMDGGQCEVLNMQVSPEGGCNAFEAKGDMSGGGDQGMETGADFAQNDDGTSGSAQPS